MAGWPEDPPLPPLDRAALTVVEPGVMDALLAMSQGATRAADALTASLPVLRDLTRAVNDLVNEVRRGNHFR